MESFILNKSNTTRLNISYINPDRIHLILFKIRNEETKELLLYQIGNSISNVFPFTSIDFYLYLTYNAQIELDFFYNNYFFKNKILKERDDLNHKFVSYRKVELSATTLQNNSLSVPRKFWLSNNWATGAIRVELVEKDFDFQSSTIGQALSWKTFSTITTTTIDTLSSAIIYQTREDYTGPLYYKIFDAKTNSLLFESVIRGYPIESETNLSKLNWQKRLTTTQIKSVYYPYEYEYYASFIRGGGVDGQSKFRLR